MPPKLGESYDNLYLIHQDGSYAKLTDIKDVDIGSSEPPDGPYATGGIVPYEKSDLLKPHDYECTFSATIHPSISYRRMYMTLVGITTKRQQRLAIRRAERIRREWLKRGLKCPLRFTMACNEIMSGKKAPKEFTFNFQGYQDKLSTIRTESGTF